MTKRLGSTGSRLYLNIFRLVIAVRLALVLIAALLGQYIWGTDALALLLSAAVLLLCLLYFYLPALHRRIGERYAYFPALLVALTVILEQRLVNAWVRGVGEWLLWQTDFTGWNITGLTMQMALVVLVTWGYGWRRALLYCLITLTFDLIVVIGLLRTPPPYVSADVRLAVSILITQAVVAFVVSQLVTYQRRQTQELETAHRQLAHYATALEKLSISRERNRLARELHDTLAHTLSAATVKLNAINVVWDANPTKARAMLTEVIAMMNDGMIEVRRALRDLRSTPLDDLGLPLALRALVESMAQRGALRLDLRLPDHFSGLTPDDEHGIYRIVQEALENVVRHAHAQSVQVHIDAHNGGYHFLIRDDGCGFDVQHTHSQSHFGLNGMVQRALMMGGRLEITSRLGAGTSVHLMMEKRA